MINNGLKHNMLQFMKQPTATRLTLNCITSVIDTLVDLLTVVDFHPLWIFCNDCFCTTTCAFEACYYGRPA